MCRYHFFQVIFTASPQDYRRSLQLLGGGLCHVATDLLMITGMSIFATILGFADLALALVLISFLNAGTNILLITVLKA
ncbi:MAG: hypothetical protein ISQ90_04780 [Rhodospirillales bacterium]|nr:hypothetical protein [Rhodospirillales bacterium]